MSEPALSLSLLEAALINANVQPGLAFSPDELHDFFKALGTNFSDLQVRQLHSMVDLKGEGIVRMSDLFAWLLQSPPTSTLVLTPQPDLMSLLDERDAAWREQLANVSVELSSLKRHVKNNPVHFTVGQYNILAGYLGNNIEPWFLYGADLTEDRRAEIQKLYDMKDDDNKYVYGKWPLYVEGILSAEEQALVEHNDRNHFQWEVRKERLLETIRQLDVDVLSLVECDHYEDHFRGGLGQLGYKSSWRQRPRRSSADGCCIAWRLGMFECIAENSIDFVDGYCERRKQEIKDRMALMVLLRVLLTGDVICVVSTHLARNPEQDQLDRLRARQVAQLTRSIGEFVQRHNANEAPVVLLGDMNATSFNRLKGIANAITLLGEDRKAHPFIFNCIDVPTGPTSVTTARNVRIDAIVYQKSRLKLVDVGETPSLSISNPIPNNEHPSDHVPISAKFSLRSPLQMGYLGAQEWYFRLLGRGSSLLTCFQLQEAFKTIDHDGLGCVTTAKLKRALQIVLDFSAFDPQDFTRVAMQLPQEGISFDIFSKMYGDCIARDGLPCQADLKAAFNMFDRNHSNELCLQEVLDAFAECAPADVPKEEIESLFSRLHTSSSGHIKLDEFLEHLSVVWSEYFTKSIKCDSDMLK